MVEKNGNTMVLLRIIGMIIVVGGIAVAIIQTNTRLTADVEYGKKEAAKLETKVEETENRCQKLDVSMAEIKTELKYLREDTREILQYIKTLK